MISEQELIRLEQLGATLLILGFSGLIVAGELGLSEMDKEQAGESRRNTGLTSDEVVVVSGEIRTLGAFILGVVASARLANLENSGQVDETSRRLSATREVALGEWLSAFGDAILLSGTLKLAALEAEPTILQ